MKTCYIFIVFFIPAIFGMEWESDETDDIIDTDSIIATDHQLVLRSTDGKVKIGTDSGTHFRAEIKDANNEAKGIYSWIDPLGNAHTTAFTAGQKGYQVLPVPKSGLSLPPFPYGLYQPRPQEAQARIKESDRPEPPLYRPPQASTYQDDDIVVIGDTEPQKPSQPSGAQTEDDLLGGFQIPPGTPVAASRPSATAVAGEKGTAQVQPQSQATAGPGGVAIAFPTASAGVGPGGVAIARPVAVSSTGDGGIAIAGGTSTAFAGLDSSTQQVLFNQAALPQNGVVMIPIVANYYFYNNQNPDQKKEVDAKPMLYSAQPRSAMKPALPQPLFYKKTKKTEKDDDQKAEYSASSMEQLQNE